MHKTTIEIIHWIWGEPKLADFLREIAAGEKIPPHDGAFEYKNEPLRAWIADFVFRENRSRGIKAWERTIGGDEDRVVALYEKLTEGRKTPAGRMEWLAEAEPELIRDALLGRKGSSDIYVHATAGRFHPSNRYRVHDSGTVYEPGWTAASGAWGLPEADRQICPDPIGDPCGCTVARRER